MRRTIVAGALTAVMTLGLGGSAVAQTEEGTQTQEEDDGMDLGWIGLLGLAGLGGLAGRKRQETGTDYRGTTR